jgi:two-component system, OmpR family, KDP operon response regulator KdpE
MSHILIVDDERAIRRFLYTALTAQGYSIVEAETGQQAINAVVQSTPDLIILDLGLPDISGIEVTRRLREWTQTPIIILSVRDGEQDKITALDAGADDYLTKPFGIGELMARIRAALRHTLPNQSNMVFKTGDLEVDLSSRIVKQGGAEVQLTPTEYDLLRILVNYAGKVLTHNQLLKEVRGNSYQDESHLLRVHMSNLRRKLEPNPNLPRYIVTEPGVGYRLLSED